MTCVCLHDSDGKHVGSVCMTNETPLRVEAAGLKWCFGCRARRQHYWELMGDVEPSYWEPTWVCRCAECGKCLTRFPGVA